MWIKSLVIVGLIFSLNSLHAQEVPPLRHFSPQTYEAGSQNWGIAQGKDHRIYVANNNGLLLYDGSTWQLHPSPNQTIIRSVAVINKKIYTGSYMEFGSWEWDDQGLLTYTSLSDRIKDRLIEDEEFWKILKIGESIAFQSLKQIYLYHPNSGAFETIPSEGSILRMFRIDEELYFQQENRGLYRFADASIVQVLSHPALLKDEIIQIVPKRDHRLVVTRNSGLFRWKDDELTAQRITDLALNQLSIYSAIALNNGNLVLGSISKGLFCLDRGLKLNRQLDQKSGLGNNTILSLFEDAEQNLWAGLDNGITIMNSNSAIKVYKDESGRLGTVYASALVNDLLYLGTNQGLFVKPVDKDQAFEFIEGTDGQVWDLSLIQGVLFCGHHKGTMIIDGTRAKLIPKTKGTWKILELDRKKDLYLQGSYDGLYVLHKSGGEWQVRNRIEGFSNSARHVEFLDNQIFVNHEYKGLFHLTVDYNFQKILNNKVRRDLIGANSGLSKYKNQILYTYSGGIYPFDQAEQTFIKSEELSKLIRPEEYVSGKLVPTSDGNSFWLFKKSGISLISQKQPDSLFNKNIPLTLGTRNDMEEYENMLRLDTGIYLMGRTDGYLRIDLPAFQIPSFQVYLTRKQVSETSEPFSQIDSGRQFFSSDENNFRFDYFAPSYKNLFQPTYQTRLKGIYEQWSNWSSKPFVTYENLPPGTYTFQLRARVGEQYSANSLEYKLSIAKPWYRTEAMIALYLTAFIVIVISMHRTYRAYYKKQQVKIMEQNLQQLEFERMKSEQEIIKLKNEKLQTSYESKSKELATSLMNIVNKNELLNQIKAQLLHLKDQEGLSSVIKTIDQNLNQKKNWEMFKEAFDNADTEFFKNLQERHPKLSPNDLKLCAYLRLNLSSKEIAPLINISPRSVEIKRYRLRKKLNLDNNENLVNYIMNV